MFLVVGLGNPGNRYTNTRHNVGFLAIEELAARVGASLNKNVFGAMVGEGSLKGKKVWLAEPQLFMNLSGQPVSSILGYYKIDKANLIVVHDELDLPFGQLRIKKGASPGGHNGIKDIHRLLGPEYIRVRVGVNRPPPGWQVADYVLSPWSAEESLQLSTVLKDAADAVESLVSVGLEASMNRFNAANAASTRQKA